MMKWEVEKETKKYIYFRGIEGNRKRYERITKRWWLPLVGLLASRPNWKKKKINRIRQKRS